MKERRLKYHWDRTKPGTAYDYSAFDGDLKFGRVLLHTTGPAPIWKWQMDMDENEPFGPFKDGWSYDKTEACIAAEAAYDAEKEKARRP